jgi:replication factor C large subunit
MTIELVDEFGMMWTELYRPKKVDDIIGNEEARLTVINWLTKWIRGSKPILLVGPPGTGKTSLVHVIAQQFNYDLIELNASDTRTRSDLERRIIPILNNTSIFGKKVLLFLDEIDGISARQDIGGIDYLTKMLKEPSIPIIVAANSKHAKIKDISKACRVIEFRPVAPKLLLLLLDKIIRREDSKLSQEQKVSIVKSTRGDIRALLNDAQSMVAGYSTTRESTGNVDIAQAINGYFSSFSAEEGKWSLLAADATYPDPRFGISAGERRKDMINALFSSIVSSRIDHHSMATLLDLISRADMIVGRAGRTRVWHLLKYLNDLVSYGLFETSHDLGIKYNQYSMSWPVMGPMFARGQSIRNFLSVLARKSHTSRSTFGSIILPYLIQILISSQVDPSDFAVNSNLDEKTGITLAREIDRVSYAKWRK